MQFPSLKLQGPYSVCSVVAVLPSASQVIAKSGSYSEALNHGLHWTVIKHQVEELCPRLPGFLAECRNSGHGTERLQSKVQTLLQLHAKGPGLQTKRNRPPH